MSGRADSEIKVKFVTEHDGSGADQASRGLDKVKSKAGESAGGFGRLGKAVASFQGAMGRVNALMSAFGVIAVIQKIVELVQAFRAAIRAKADLDASINSDNAKAGVERLKAAYDDLRASIAAADRATADARATTDLLVEAERRLQDAALTRREEDEVAAISRDDPLAAEKEKAVRARYAKTRAESASSRGVDDASAAEARQREDIAAAEARIAERETLIRDMEQKARETLARAASANERSAASSRKTDIWGRRGRWGFGWQREESEQYAGYAEKFRQQGSAALDASIRARKDNEADLAAVAASRARLAALARSREAAAAEGANVQAAAGRASASADTDLSDARDRRARDAARLDRARADASAAGGQKAALDSDLAASRARSAKEADDAWRARNAYEAHAASRGANPSKKWEEALRQLADARDREEAEAAAAARQLTLLGEATAKHMKEINDRAASAERLVKSLSSKLTRDPYGDAEAQQ